MPTMSGGAAPDDDRRFFLAAGLAILVLVNLPVAWAYLQPAPPGKRFIGAMHDFPGDIYYHMSFATQAARGSLLFEDKYNGAEVRTRAFPNAVFLVVGSTERAGLGDEAAYHLARNLAAVLLLFAIHQLVVGAIETRPWRRVGFLLAPLGAGFGWIPHLSGLVQYPGPGGDFAAWYARAVTVNPAFGWVLDGWLLELSPYWLMETEFIAPTVMALVVLFWARFADPRTWSDTKRLALLAALPVAVALAHPHDLVNLGFTTGCLLIWGLCARVRPPWLTWRIAWLAVPVLPCVAWMAWLLVADPVLHEYAFLTDPENRLGLVAGLGLPAAVLAWRLRDVLAGSWPLRVVLAAAAACVLLFTLPMLVTGQYYNIHALSIFVAVAAVAALERLARRASRLAVGAAALVLLLAPWTNVALVAVQAARVRNPGSDYHVSEDLYRLLERMRRMLPQEAVVLAEPSVSQLVPFKVGCRVVLAQAEQTADFGELEIRFQEFVARQRTAIDLSFLDGVQATHLLIDPELRAGLGDGLPRFLADRRLQPVLREGEYELLAYRSAALLE
jgi:hypothetical protein